MPWVTQTDNTIAIGPNQAEGQRLTAGGLLIGRKQAGDGHLYGLISKSGDKIQVWGCAAIDGFFEPHHVGKFTKYRYLATVKTRTGRDYKQVEVIVLEGENEPDNTDPKLKLWPHYEEYQTYTRPVPQDFSEPPNAVREEAADDPFGSEEEEDDLPFNVGL